MTMEAGLRYFDVLCHNDFEGVRKTTNISITTVGVQAEIRSQHPLNTRTVQEHCRLSHLNRKSLPLQSIP